MIAQVLDDVIELRKTGLTESLSNSENAFNDIRDQLNETINEHIPNVEKALDSAGREIKSVSNQITKTFDNFSRIIDENSDRHFDTADRYIKKYSVYRYYVGLGISSVLLLILLCIVFGLLCGICGNRPSGYGDDCCNKGAGSKCLML